MFDFSLGEGGSSNLLDLGNSLFDSTKVSADTPMFSGGTYSVMDNLLGGAGAAGSLISGGASYLSSVGDWWGGLQPGTQGLLSSVALGAGNAMMASRNNREQIKQYDRQREYERQMRADDRAELNKMREVPSADLIGINAKHSWSK